MKLSTRSRYGLRLMFDLAAHYGTGPEAISAIAQRQGVSDLYLEQIVAPLRRAGLVASQRGAQGGYSLAQRPDAITVGQVMRLLEGSLAPADCVLHDDECDHAPTCAMHRLYARIRDSINDVVDHMTLSDLVEDDIMLCTENACKENTNKTAGVRG